MDQRDYSRFLGVGRAIAANLVALIRSRLELFAVEVQEEKARMVRLLLWLVASIVVGGTAFLFLNLTIVYLTAENWRWATLLGLSLFYLLVLAAIALAIRRQLKSAAMPFSQTIRELNKDRECLQKDD